MRRSATGPPAGEVAPPGAEELLTALRDGYCVLDGEGRILEVSERLLEDTGYTAAELIGSAPPHVAWPEDERERIGRELEHALAAEGGRSEMRLRRADGTLFDAVVDVSPVPNGAGRPDRFLCLVRDVTEEVAARNRLRGAYQIARLLSWEWDPEADRAHIAPEGQDALREWFGDGGGIEEFAARIEPSHREEVVRAIRRLVETGGELTLTYPVRLPGGVAQWIETRAACRRALDGRLVVTGTGQDITPRLAVARKAALLDQVDAAVVATDLDGTVTDWNHGAEKMYGWGAEEVVGRPITELTVGPQDHALAAEIMETVRARGAWEGEFEVHRRDGSSMPVFVRNQVIRDEAGAPIGIVGVSVDISPRVEAEEHLRDTRNFLDAVTHSMGEGLVTIDGEGRVTFANETAGNLLGREPREMLGHRMCDLVRVPNLDPADPDSSTGSIVSRPEAPGPSRVDDAVFVRRDGSEMPTAYSTSPLTGQGPDAEGSVIVFSDVSAQRAREEALRREVDSLATLSRVRSALAEDRLVLHAQPIADVTGGSVVEHELLLRIVEPDGTVILPGVFLPAAERHGLVGQLDRWVMAQAAALAASGMRVAINVSARSVVDPGLADHLEAELEAAGADPRRLVVELTETALLTDQAAGLAFAEHVSRIGCSVALDDFGTGYASFQLLKSLPVDELKIDIEFVRDVEANEASRHVIEAVVSLAKRFGLVTVAEGVEDPATLGILARLGVDRAQGHAIGRPRPVGLTTAERSPTAGASTDTRK